MISKVIMILFHIESEERWKALYQRKFTTEVFCTCADIFFGFQIYDGSRSHLGCQESASRQVISWTIRWQRPMESCEMEEALYRSHFFAMVSCVSKLIFGTFFHSIAVSTVSAFARLNLCWHCRHMEWFEASSMWTVETAEAKTQEREKCHRSITVQPEKFFAFRLVQRVFFWECFLGSPRLVNLQWRSENPQR